MWLERKMDVDREIDMRGNRGPIIDERKDTAALTVNSENELSSDFQMKEEEDVRREDESVKIFSLPLELIVLIFSYVDGRTLLRSRRVCKYWRHLTQNEYLWKRKCQYLNLNLTLKPITKTFEWYCLAYSLKFFEIPFHYVVGTGEYLDGIYSGDWVNGKPNGYGYYKEYSKNRTISIYGEYKEGKLSGEGTAIEHEGNLFHLIQGGLSQSEMERFAERYTGQYTDGMKVYGKKWYRMAQGYDIYHGEWMYNTRNGYGLYMWVNGDRCEGYWKNGQIHGRARYYWSDGRWYEGEWDDHNQTGYGVHEWPDGVRYEGFWKKGKRHGLGVLIYGTTLRERWEGEWENDIRLHMEGPLPWDSFFRLNHDQQRCLILKLKENLTKQMLQPKYCRIKGYLREGQEKGREEVNVSSVLSET
jgi:hypothetical protein